MDYSHLLLEKYRLAATKKSDIYEHIPTLRNYAKLCSHVTELGVREPTSTWAFLKGLYDSEKDTTKKLVCCDIYRSPKINVVHEYATGLGIKFDFKEGNDIHIDLEDTDLLFIDTWHVYGHLKRELKRHAPITRHYIIMHDTTIDALYGESIRCKHDIKTEAFVCGYPESEIRKGIWPAIEEFIHDNPHWVIHERFENNNGLTILKRIHD